MKKSWWNFIWNIIVIYNSLIFCCNNNGNQHRKRNVISQSSGKAERNLQFDNKVNCPSQILHSYEDCFEIGCKLGTKCRRPELRAETCCPYVYKKLNISCCRGVLQCKPHIKGCPPRESTKSYNCMEKGCSPGHRCKTPSLQNQICCFHSFEGYEVTCCLADLDTLNAVPEEVVSESASSRCPEQKKGFKYDCLNLGCELGTSCEVVYLPDQECCPYQGGSRIMNCCLKNSSLPSPPPNFTVPTISHEGCRRLKRLPYRSSCMEIGCSVGEHCTEPGTEGITCCTYTARRQKVNCCLINADNNILDGLVIPPPIDRNGCPSEDISLEKYNCLEANCVIIEPCSTKGLEDRVCCLHKIKGTPITCCLAKIKKEKDNEKALSPSQMRTPKPFPLIPDQSPLSKSILLSTPLPKLFSSPPPKLLLPPLPPSLPSPPSRKPGQCPIITFGSCPPCRLDSDCPGIQKCCSRRSLFCCTAVHI